MGKAWRIPRWLIGLGLLVLGAVLWLMLCPPPSDDTLLFINGVIYLVASGIVVLSLSIRGDPCLIPQAIALVGATLSAQLLGWTLLPPGPAGSARDIALMLSSILPWAFLAPAILRRDRDAWLAVGMLGTGFFGTGLAVFTPFFRQLGMLIATLMFLTVSLLLLYSTIARIRLLLRRQAARQGGGHGVKGGHG